MWLKWKYSLNFVQIFDSQVAGVKLLWKHSFLQR